MVGQNVVRGGEVRAVPGRRRVMCYAAAFAVPIGDFDGGLTTSEDSYGGEYDS